MAVRPCKPVTYFNRMPKFVVSMVQTQEFRAVVEADSKEDAERMAEQMWSDTNTGYGWFKDDDYLDHRIDEVFEASDDDLQRYGDVVTQEDIDADLTDSGE